MGRAFIPQSTGCILFQMMGLYTLGLGCYRILLRLAALFVGNAVTCGAFLTGYNPRGTVQSDEANDQAHAQLAAKLQKLGLQAIEGSGSEEGTEWPAEKSYFALGLALEPAKAIGTHFDQDAIVWVGPDAVPQLILLR